MAPHQERVVNERNDLVEKTQKLAAFLDTPTYAALDTAEQARLGRQLRIMNDYVEVLGDRIAAF